MYEVLMRMTQLIIIVAQFSVKTSNDKTFLSTRILWTVTVWSKLLIFLGRGQLLPRFHSALTSL